MPKNSSRTAQSSQPGQKNGPEYHQVSAGLGVGTMTKVTVLEMHDRPNWWRVWVNHRAASPPIYLPQSDHRWSPIATAESWDGGTGGACNTSRCWSVVTMPERWFNPARRGIVKKPWKSKRHSVWSVGVCPYAGVMPPGSVPTCGVPGASPRES